LLDDLLGLVPPKSTTYAEMQFQLQFSTALQALCIACFTTSMASISFKWKQMRLSFYRRYKWVYMPEYENIVTESVGQPDLEELLPDVQEILQDESFGDFSPAESVNLAEMILSGLVRSGNVGGWAGAWGEDRIRVLEGLIKACRGLKGIPTSVSCMDEEDWDADRLEWDVGHHPWFPRYVAQTEKETQREN